MNWKEFFKPTIKKIIFFIILFILTSLIPSRSFIIVESFCGYPDGICLDEARGLPISYYQLASGGIGGWNYGGLIYPFLVIDLIFWYLVSCPIIWIYDKVRKR